MPQVSAEGSRSQSDSESGSYSQSFSMGLTARQSLFSGLRDAAGVERSAEDLWAAEMGLASAKTRVGYDLKKAFADGSKVRS